MSASSDTPLRADDAHLLAQVTRAYRTLSAGNRTLLRATDEQDLLTKMCRVVVESGGYTLACVGYAEHDPTQRIHWMAYAGFDPNLRHMTWADIPAGQTASGTAIRTGEPVIGRNLRTSVGYAAWRDKGIEQLLAQGLAYLQRLPVDSIKIDQSFIRSILSDNDSATIVRSTIELRHNLDLDIVAEGVESRETWDYLATLGCDAVQGNFVSLPMPSEQFLGWESRWRAEHRAPAPSH